MKKSTKVVLIFGIIFFTLGIILISVGSICGGLRSSLRWLKNGDLNFSFGIFDWYHSSHDLNDNYPVFEGDGVETISLNVDSIREFVLSAEGADVEISTSEEDVVTMRYENAWNVQCFVEEDILYVIQEVRGIRLSGNTKVYVTVPSYIDMDEIYIEAGAGKIIINDMDSRKTVVELGAGKLEMNNVNTGSTDIEIGAGSATIVDGKTTDFKIDVGAGSFNYEGIVAGNVNAECSMGNIHMDIIGKKSDYNYNVDCAMGKITVGGSSYGGLGSEKSVDNGSDKTLDLDCSMGNITVKFK